jgi:predicted metal-dependent peptidase
VPGGWQRWAEELLGEPKVDWRTALGALVRGGVVDAMGAVDYRFNRPNRRTDQRVAPRVILPSLRQPVPRIGVVIDTSGSMSEADLTVAMRELAGILGTLGCAYGTRVYSVDAAVHVAQSVFDIGQVALVGGGGTDMGIGIAAAGDDGCDVVVVLTDCCTPWPIEAPSCYVVVAAIAKEEPGGVPSWATMIHVPPDALHESLTVAA